MIMKKEKQFIEEIEKGKKEERDMNMIEKESTQLMKKINITISLN